MRLQIDKTFELEISKTIAYHCQEGCSTSFAGLDSYCHKASLRGNSCFSLCASVVRKRFRSWVRYFLGTLFSSSIFSIDNLAIQISWHYHRYCYSILPTCRSKYIRAGGVLTFISSWAKRRTKLWQSGHIFQNIIIQWNTSSRYTANTTRKKHARICAFESERKPIVYQSLVSSKRSLLLSKPTQAFKKLSRALRCLLRLLTTSVPKEDSLEYCSVVMMESYRVSQEEP